MLNWRTGVKLVSDPGPDAVYPRPAACFQVHVCVCVRACVPGCVSVCVCVVVPEDQHLFWRKAFSVWMACRLR